MIFVFSKFDVMLENPHIIEPGQLWAGILKKGPRNVTLTSAYKSRDSPEYLADLGYAIGKLEILGNRMY
jgi:hypothetical protein